MIEFYHQLALRLKRISLLLWAGLAASSVFFGYVIFSEQSFIKQDQELSALVLPLWFLSMIALKSYFSEITASAPKGTGFFKRVWVGLKRAVSWLVALAFSIITLCIFYLTYRAVVFLI